MRSYLTVLWGRVAHNEHTRHGVQLWCSAAKTLRILSSPKSSKFYFSRCETYAWNVAKPNLINSYSAHSGYNDPIKSSHKFVTPLWSFWGRIPQFHTNKDTGPIIFLPSTYIHFTFLLACLTMVRLHSTDEWIMSSAPIYDTIPEFAWRYRGKPVKRAGLSANIRTGNLPNMGKNHYRLSQSARLAYGFNVLLAHSTVQNKSSRGNIVK
jgi:hypothetical protein